MKTTKRQLARIIKEEFTRIVAEGGELQNTAKGAAMSLLDTAKSMEQAPSHEPASMYAQEVAKQANLIMDMLVDMEP